MNLVTNQKLVVSLICLAAILAMVFTGKTDGATAVDFVKWIAAAYIGSEAITTAAQKIGLSRMNLTPGTPAHAEAMRALGAKPATSADVTANNTAVKS